MLATLAALHLVVSNQIAPPREVTPADAVQEEAAPGRGVPAPVEVTAPAEPAPPAAGPPPSGIWATPPAVGAPPAAPPAAQPPAAPAPPAPASPPATAYPAPPESPPLPSKAAPSPWAPPAEPAAAYPAAQAPPENPPLPSKAAPSPYAPPAQPDASQAAQAPPPAAAEPVPLPKPPSGPVLPPPPEGRAASPPTASPPSAPAAAPQPPASPPVAPAAGPPRTLSLLSGETLEGASAALAWAGWSALGIAYAQGLSPKDDLGAFLDYDWAKSELVLALAYRRSVGRTGGWDMASRLSAGYYTNLGSTLVDDENRSDRGIEVTPGLSVSRSGQAGVFSAVVEGPITVTWKYGAGLLFSPRLTLAFETPVYHEVTVGFRAGAAYRAGAGQAPLKLGTPEFVFLVLAGYQLL